MDLAEYEPYEPTLDKSITLEVAEETHTLGNVLRDVMWSHPHVELSSYTQEHPSKQEIIFRCQTSGLISGEQALVEALHMTKDMLSAISEAMGAAVERFEAEGGAAAVDEEVEEQEGEGGGEEKET